jgi:hypothetical protein
MPQLWNLEDAISKLPEVYTESVAPDTVEQYRLLLSNLPTEVQRWITSMGWALEDLSLDANELAVLDMLVNKSVPSAMTILTSPRLIDGVTSEDVTWAQQRQIESLQALLQDDLDQLMALGLLSNEGKVAVDRLTQMAAWDFEIAKGLYLIDSFGHPQHALFGYPVPDFNTQLYLLALLAEKGIPVGHEVAAVAAGLDYGTLWTIADDEVRVLIPDYAHGMVLYQAETDSILVQRGATWQARDLPLEGQIALVWGAPGNYMAVDTEEAQLLNIQREPHYGWRGFYRMFGSAQYRFQKKHWDWDFVKIDYLRQMRDYLIQHHSLAGGVDPTSDTILLFWDGSMDKLEDPALIKIDGREVYASYITNMNFQWDRFKSKGRFLGKSGDAYIDSYLKKAVNIAGITPTVIVHLSGYFDPVKAIWRAADLEVNPPSPRQNPVDSWLGWNKVLWDNFAFKTEDHGRFYFLFPYQCLDIWGTGIPPGYIYREHIGRMCPQCFDQ